MFDSLDVLQVSNSLNSHIAKSGEGVCSIMQIIFSTLHKVLQKQDKNLLMPTSVVYVPNGSDCVSKEEGVHTFLFYLYSLYSNLSRLFANMIQSFSAAFLKLLRIRSIIRRYMLYF